MGSENFKKGVDIRRIVWYYNPRKRKKGVIQMFVINSIIDIEVYADLWEEAQQVLRELAEEADEEEQE